jgi:hypothetical protein
LWKKGVGSLIEVSIVIGDNQYIVPCGKSVGSLIEVSIVIGYNQ